MLVLARMFSATRALFAHAVPQKGVDANCYAAKMISDSIAWLGHARVAVRSDNEPAIVKLVTVATNLLKLSEANATNGGPPPYDPQASRAAKLAV